MPEDAGQETTDVNEGSEQRGTRGLKPETGKLVPEPRFFDNLNADLDDPNANYEEIADKFIESLFELINSNSFIQVTTQYPNLMANLRYASTVYFDRICDFYASIPEVTDVENFRLLFLNYFGINPFDELASPYLFEGVLQVLQTTENEIPNHVKLLSNAKFLIDLTIRPDSLANEKYEMLISYPTSVYLKVFHYIFQLMHTEARTLLRERSGPHEQ